MQPADPPRPATLPPELLLAAYANGIFPMADSADDDQLFWVEPEQRAIMPIDGFHLSRSLRRTIVRDTFAVTANRCFADVVAACAAPGPGREGTWINRPIRDGYAGLHRLGHAHSIECWQDDRLVGGLYGVSLGRAFFGESMFSRVSDASKVALAWLVARLRVGGFTLLDCQFQTDHLHRLGAVEISQAAYLERLYGAVAGVAGAAAGAAAGGVVAAGAASGDWGALDALLAAGAAVAARAGASDTGSSPGHAIVQLLTNTS